jgi:hypothetical protein
MSLVLTEKSTLVCAHHGTVKLTATQSKLTVAGAKVLVTGDLSSAPIPDCPIKPPPPTNKPCTAILTAVGGVSTRLKVGGKGVLLETVNGATDGTVTPTWSVQDAGQSKLKAP